jgi:hypothetical protein
MQRRCRVLIILIILVFAVLLLVLAGLMLNLYFRNQKEMQSKQQNRKSRKKSPTAQLHDLIFRRKEYTAPLEVDD